MQQVILSCLISFLFLTPASASEDLAPSRRFQVVQMLPQLEAAFRSNDETKLIAAAKRLTHALVDTKWQIFDNMLQRAHKNMPPMEDIQIKMGLCNYEYKKGTRDISKTVWHEETVAVRDMDVAIEGILQKCRHCNDLKSFLTILYRKTLNMEILSLALDEAPDSLWQGAVYSRVLTQGELDDAWAKFRWCYSNVWDHLWPDTKEYYTNHKLSATSELNFMGYDIGVEEDPRGWLSWTWNIFRCCGKKIYRKKEEKEHLYLAQMSIRLLDYAISPEFQAVTNPKFEDRIHYTPWQRNLFDVFCYSCMKCRGYWKGKPYNMVEWRKLPAQKRTKHKVVEKQLAGQVTRNVFQSVKRTLGAQTLAEKKDEIFNTLANEKERLQQELMERSQELASLQAELRSAQREKSDAESREHTTKLDAGRLKKELAALQKKYEEGEEGIREKQIQQLSKDINALKKVISQQKSEISQLQAIVDDKERVFKAHHESYERLQEELNGKDTLIRQLQKERSALPDEATVQQMKATIEKLRDKITTLDPLVQTRKIETRKLKSEIHDLQQRLIAQDMHIEHLSRNQRSPREDSSVGDPAVLKREEEERDELQKALAEQTKRLEEEKKSQAQLQLHLASAKTFLEEGSFLQNKPAQQPGDGDNEIIQRQAVHIVRLEDQLRLAYSHVQQLYAWSAYLEGGWTYTAAQLSSMVAPVAAAEEAKYDIYAGGELFKLTWAEIQACTKEYLREHVVATRPEGEGSIENDNNKEQGE